MDSDDNSNKIPQPKSEKLFSKKTLAVLKNKNPSPFGSTNNTNANLTNLAKPENGETETTEVPQPKKNLSGINKTGVQAESQEDAHKAYQKLFDNNLNWVKGKLATNSNYFLDYNNLKNSKYLVIACSDSYVNIYDIIGACPSEVYLHRNVGNLALSVDFNIQSIIQHAVEILKIKHIIVIGHTDCEAINNAVSCKYHGLIDHWLSYIRDAAEKNYEELAIFVEKYPDLLHRKLTELNIKEQVLNICKNPIVQKAWHNGQEISVHGCIYETESGLLRDLEIEHQWKDIEDHYNLKFTDWHKLIINKLNK